MQDVPKPLKLSAVSHSRIPVRFTSKVKKFTSKTVRCNGKGIILLPEDRQKEGLIMSWGLGRNVTLPTISKYAKKGFNDEKTERDLSKRLLEEVDTKAVDIFQPASSLSGGNQQKVVVAKALAQEMKVVIMDEPTKGVDVGAKAEIYAIMGDLAKKAMPSS